ncbi:hypothetical protein Sj15T_24140 [Sphingobium sp. TA15]|nr:hypothetical protein [Sphingobium indicum]BDD67393.1 hypothetical protein Sj15T_24140 [Sphingobium sp. TA15]
MSDECDLWRNVEAKSETSFRRSLSPILRIIVSSFLLIGQSGCGRGGYDVDVYGKAAKYTTYSITENPGPRECGILIVPKSFTCSTIKSLFPKEVASSRFDEIEIMPNGIPDIAGNMNCAPTVCKIDGSQLFVSQHVLGNICRLECGIFIIDSPNVKIAFLYSVKQGDRRTIEKIVSSHVISRSDYASLIKHVSE